MKTHYRDIRAQNGMPVCGAWEKHPMWAFKISTIKILVTCEDCLTILKEQRKK